MVGARSKPSATVSSSSFPAHLPAARCAVDIQRTLHERNNSAPPERRIEVRIGLHLGDVVAQDARVHGDGVNIAARIEPLAEPGGICLSEDVARQIQNKIELPLLRLGRADLKNIKMPVEIYRLVLPWERKHLPGSERLAFSMRQREMRRTLIGAGGLLVAGGLTGAWVWRRARESEPLVNNRIAVLPFVSMSASPDDEYFVDGITEELISRLSRVEGLEVIARTSIASYKGTRKNIGQIAGELNVGTVLEGSVRTAGGKVRITAQLINAANDAHLWSEDYDRELKDVFAVQTDIAQRVADALAQQLRHLGDGTARSGRHVQCRGVQRLPPGALSLQQGRCGGSAQGDRVLRGGDLTGSVLRGCIRGTCRRARATRGLRGRLHRIDFRRRGPPRSRHWTSTSRSPRLTPRWRW